MLEGKKISGRYKVLEIIGGGGMSHVYLAHDKILNRDVAMKVLRYDFTNEEELHRRFQREASSVTSLAHPNIVAIYDVGEDQDIHYIVMEYVKGKTLKQYIQEFAPLSPAKSVQIMKQLTSAIAHAHENGIIHRDIKPQNILMDEQGNVKVTDFGIALTTSATSFTQTNSVLGTVHYLSPEQARGGVSTKKSDIYALGIVLYELLTGQLPFSGESAVSIALKHLQSDTPSVRDFDASIPQSVENIVLKATMKDPLHRYVSIEAMQSDLETVLSPNRINEPKFTVSLDEEMTKAMPAIKTAKPFTAESITEQPKQASNPSTVAPSPPANIRKKKIQRFVIGGVGFVFLLWLLLSLFSSEKIEIPDLKNKTVDEATAELEKLGFVIGKTIERNHTEIEKDMVIDTDPEAGSEREEGSEVSLIVSLGSETVEMEDFVGKQIDQVANILQVSDFRDTEIDEQYSREPEGTIIKQQPAAGEEVVPSETEVVLVVSQGQQMSTLSDLQGYNASALKEYAKTTGFDIQVSEEQYSKDVPVGHVISQSPVAGTTLVVGSKVTVVVSKGQEEKKVKMYIRSVKIPYDSMFEGQPQQVQIYIQDKNNTMAEPFEEMTITDEKSYSVRLEIAEGEKAAYRIVKDSIVIAEETVSYDSLK